MEIQAVPRKSRGSWRAVYSLAAGILSFILSPGFWEVSKVVIAAVPMSRNLLRYLYPSALIVVVYFPVSFLLAISALVIGASFLRQQPMSKKNMAVIGMILSGISLLFLLPIILAVARL